MPTNITDIKPVVLNPDPVHLEVTSDKFVNAISPRVDVEDFDGGARLIITDYRNQPQEVTIYDGPQGPQGEQGDPGYFLINAINGLTNYINGPDSSFAGYGLQVNRYYTTVKINGYVGPGNTQLKIKLNGETQMAGATPAFLSFTDPVKLIDGHTYRWRMVYIMGSASTSVLPMVVPHGAQASIGIQGSAYNENYCEFKYTDLDYPDGVHMTLSILRTEGSELSDYTVECILEDMTISTSNLDSKVE